MRIDHTLRPIVAVTTTSAAAGYPAANIATREIYRPWRSTEGGAQTVTLDLGSAMGIAALWVQAVNFPSAAVSYSTDDTTYPSAGTLTTAVERNGRRKGHLPLAITARYLRLGIAAGTPGAGHWTIGSAFVFAVPLTLPIAPVYGLTRETIFPQVGRTLPNGRAVVARTGPFFTRLAGQFAYLASEDVGALIRHARASGIIGVDLELSNEPWLSWPMEYLEGRYQDTLDNVALRQMDFALQEVV